ncbi:MAG TPA: N-acetylneuraminate synthase family protein [Vicinamibacterales bacterium]|nr:N-acetylneuraminate synthase family protein [Vicinamibacterales bacterium]
MAATAGADAVKFQKRTVEDLATRSVLDAVDDRFPAFGQTYREIREHLEFGWDEYVELKSHCDQRQITFLCTAFDIPAASFLERLEVPGYKVASHSLTNLPLLEYLAARGRPVVMSTGMCTLEEIDDAVGMFRDSDTRLALMHCVSSYPQPAEESNLGMVAELRDRYGLPVGYSGHELGYLPTLASVALGADLVERHVTLDRSAAGFDHRLSLEPDELSEMIQSIRTVELATRPAAKSISETEMITRRKYQASIVAARDIGAGETITEAMLTLKNPGTGLPARRMTEVAGNKAKVFIPADTLLDLQMVERD